MESIESQVPSRLKSKRKEKAYLFGKRVMDILFSLTLLILLSPLILFITWRIYRKEGKPIFYQEYVASKDGKGFCMYTFRTMTNPSRVIRALPPHPFPKRWEKGVPDKFSFQRNEQCTMTPIGIWLQKYKLHVLPKLWNVLKGELSFVGPEPEIVEITAYYNHKQKRRLAVKPGITGYAQVYGSSQMNYTEKVVLDLHYIEHHSLKVDIKILFATLHNWKKVL